MTIFAINPALSGALWQLVPNRVISAEFSLTLTKEQLRLFVDVSVHADGCRKHSSPRGMGPYASETIVQSSQERLDAFDLPCALLGIATSRTEATGGWLTHLKRRKFTAPLRDHAAETVAYTGTIWCPTTRNRTWLARRRGTVYFTGNSNRIYVVTGHGGFFLAPEVEGMAAEGWVAGKHYASYDPDNINSLLDGIERWTLDQNAAERQDIAASGRDFCRANFTYAKRVEQMLAVLRPIVAAKGGAE